MLFTTIEFFILLSITFILYYLPFLKKLQIPILVISSFTFYAYQSPILLILLISSILINIISSYGIIHYKSISPRVIAIAGVSINLLILFFFKYAGLFATTFGFQESSLGTFLIEIPLPIGISFFTFQGISLVVDCYKSKDLSEYKSIVVQNLLQHSKSTFLFISLFPQLIAGPIVKAHDFYNQIEPKTISKINWNIVIHHLILGYFLKAVVADNLNQYTFWLERGTNISSLGLISLLVSYSIQIFADFAGYSYIAIGLSRLFGYTLFQNFNYPYLSTSFSEFWTRWHISLSTFLKEYLYIPLGGNRKGNFRTYINLFIVMFLGGLWHGAGWQYALWGSFHGVFLAIERLLLQWKLFPKELLFVKILKWNIVFWGVTFSWLFFKMPSMELVYDFYMNLFSNLNLKMSLFHTKMVFNAFMYSIPVVVYYSFKLIPFNQHTHPFLYNTIKSIIFGFLLFLILTNSGPTASFVYFQF